MTNESYTWVDFDEGNSIGELGSEGGKIIRDEENRFGARVTLEGSGYIAPFSITLGIYGLTFHTAFFSHLGHAQESFETFKAKIEEVINHYAVLESERDNTWSERHHELMEEIVDIQ